jgi:hypothetical protein
VRLIGQPPLLHVCQRESSAQPFGGELLPSVAVGEAVQLAGAGDVRQDLDPVKLQERDEIRDRPRLGQRRFQDVADLLGQRGFALLGQCDFRQRRRLPVRDCPLRL